MRTDEMLYTVATVGAMREYETVHAGKSAQCLDIRSGDTFSGTSGDYWNFPLEGPLMNDEGEPLLLVVP
jgi:hypothetical protein